MSYEIDEKNGTIKLTPIEATAYFWTSRIRNTVRDIITSPIRSKTEDDKKFADIFYRFTEHDWRKLYLGLTRFIEEEVANYTPEKTDEFELYNQGTAIGDHDRINEKLSSLLDTEIPDIRLVLRTCDRDTIVYTDDKVVFSVYGGRQNRNWKLDEYLPLYTITGDEDELDFYNQLLATMLSIRSIKRENGPFSKFTLKSRFCDEYVRLNGEYLSLEDVDKKFDDCFHIITQINNIATASYHRDDYYVDHTDYDCFGLEGYKELANQYADYILYVNKSQDDKPSQYGKGGKK